tara:strand:+ start:33 stop:518 length:486 start_codon:yes stop_codon:yes gene_type:complete
MPVQELVDELEFLPSVVGYEENRRLLPLEVEQEAANAAIAYAKNDPDGNEVVGVFRGVREEPFDEFVPITNIYPGEGASYLVHPQEIMDAIKNTTFITPHADFWGMFFHSHPKWLAYPSISDLHNAAFQGHYSIYSIVYDELNAFYFDGTMWKPRLLCLTS